MDIIKKSSEAGPRIGFAGKATAMAVSLAVLASGCWGVGFEWRAGFVDMDDHNTYVAVPTTPPPAINPANPVPPLTPPQANTGRIPSATPQLHAYPQYRYGLPPRQWDSRKTASTFLVLAGVGIVAMGSQIEDPDYQSGMTALGGAMTLLGGISAVSLAFEDETYPYGYSSAAPATGTKTSGVVLGPTGAAYSYRW